MVDFKYKKLGDLATFINGYAFKPKDWSANGLPIIRIQNLNNPEAPYNYYDNGDIDDKYIIHKGDILISWSASIGVYEWKKERALLNQHIYKVKFDKDNNIDKSYFKYAVKYVINRALNHMHGSTMKHFTKKFFESIEVPVPDIKYQRIISSLLGKSEELLEKRKEQISALSSLKQSIFLDMFGELIFDGFSNRVKLSEVTTKITDGTHHSPPRVENGYPYVSAKHLKNGKLDFYCDPVYISEEDHNKIYAKCNPEYGDVLYIKDGATTGIAAINQYDFEFSMLSSLALIKCEKTQLNNYYLVYYLNNEITKRRVLNNLSGGAIKRLTLKKIKNIQIALPPLKEQLKFANYVRKVDEQLALIEKNLKELEKLYHSLTYQAFNGDIF